MTAEWSEIVWTDIVGRARSVRRPTRHLHEPIYVPRSLAASGFGTTVDGGEVLELRPDSVTAVVNPLEPSTQIVIGDLYEPSGRPSPLCSRSALRGVLDRAVNHGFELNAAVELECYLVDAQTRKPVYDVTDCYGIPRGDQYEPIFRTLRNDLVAMGISIEASNLEYSGGQFEVNIRYSEALRAADNGLLLRLLTGRVAQAVGLHATFMAKPWTEQAGSGMHIHQSLWRDGTNVFADGAGGLSALGRSYTAGLLRHMAEFALLGSSTVNSYHRRSEGSFAPTVACWGSDNRTLAIRSITGSAAATRIEQRDAAADCNIHLAMAGQFAAGLSGIDEQLEAPPAMIGNAYKRTDLERLPRTFLESYEALQDSAAARELLGVQTVEAYLRALEPEIEALLGSCPQWERDRYMEPTPATASG